MTSALHFVPVRGATKRVMGRPKARAAWRACLLWGGIYGASFVTNPALRAAGPLFAIGFIVNGMR
ncbi:MAG TPA: hypothetical protein VFQ35_02555, partial [Polyangiaceae bacterium]|nr:hypothetical protein [Polyangiaceae bacterium]